MSDDLPAGPLVSVRVAQAPEGTRWAREGERGASIADLLDESGTGSACDADRAVRTSLVLTGQPLSHRDHGRITDAIAWAREGR